MDLSISETIEVLSNCATGRCDQCKLSWSQCDELIPYVAKLLSKLDIQLMARKAWDAPTPCTHEASLPGDYTCPICKNVVSQREHWGESIIYVVPKYCHFCGQRICKEEDCEETLYLNAHVRHEP